MRGSSPRMTLNVPRTQRSAQLFAKRCAAATGPRFCLRPKKPGSRFCEAALRKSYALHRARDTRTSPHPPADLGGKALVEIEIVGRLRLLAHAFVEAMGVVADQDAPALGLDAVENGPCRLRCRRWRVFLKSPRLL